MLHQPQLPGKWGRSGNGHSEAGFIRDYIYVSHSCRCLHHTWSRWQWGNNLRRREPMKWRADPMVSSAVDTRPSPGHRQLQQKHSTPVTLQQGTDCSPSLKVSLCLIYRISSFCNNNHLHCRRSILPFLHPALYHISKFDSVSCHEQKLHCLGPSARYFGR